MPELPEVECVVRALGPHLKNRRIEDVKFYFEQMLQQGIKGEEFARRLRGREILDVKRQGKYIFISLDSDLLLEIHLRMTGRFLFAPSPFPPDKYTGVVFYFEGGSVLHFQDVRKFGTFRIWEGDEALTCSPAYRLGPDPLSEQFSFAFFRELLQKKGKVRIKPLLLNQQNLAGLGNIYVDETLFRARIHPERTAASLKPSEIKRLFEAMGTVLQESIRRGGTTFSDYRDVEGRSGNFQEHLMVYRREKEPCPGCSTPVARTVVCGRGTYYCPSCQKESRKRKSKVKSPKSKSKTHAFLGLSWS